MGDHAQLDLVVVGDQELPALGGDEGPPEASPFFTADGDVVKVGVLRTQPAGAGDGLVEAGVDAVVTGDESEQALAVRRPELLDLAVAQKLLDDGVLAAQFLERRGVGGEARLGSLLRLQAELLEQDAAQLLGGIDDERLAGVVLDLLLEPAHLRLETVDEAPQILDVDAHAHLLHARQNTDERPLDVVVQLEQVAGVHCRAKGRRQTGHGHCTSPGVLSGLVLAAVEVELAGGRGVGRAQLEAEVAHGQVLEQVVGLTGVYEVGGDGRVEIERTDIDAEGVEGPHQLLGAMGLERRAAVGDEAGESPRNLLVAEQIGGEELRRLRTLANGEGQGHEW